jgi:hypothetical protein
MKSMFCDKWFAKIDMFDIFHSEGWIVWSKNTTFWSWKKRFEFLVQILHWPASSFIKDNTLYAPRFSPLKTNVWKNELFWTKICLWFWIENSFSWVWNIFLSSNWNFSIMFDLKKGLKPCSFKKAHFFECVLWHTSGISNHKKKKKKIPTIFSTKYWTPRKHRSKISFNNLSSNERMG